MAVLTDDTGRSARYLFSTPPRGATYASRSVWRRLVVHVADIDEPDAIQRVMAALRIELLYVPF